MTIKKILLKISLFSLVLFFPILILAQNTSTNEAESNLIQERNTKRIEIRERIEAQKEIFQEKRNEFQERKQEAIEKNKAKREQFKEKLQALKDKRKQGIVERVDTKITTLNKLHTDRLNNILEKLSNILEKLQKKTDTLETQGKDVSSLDTLIETANTAILTAQTAVNEQAGKDYVIEIQDEKNLGEVVSAAHLNFKNDIKEVRDLVKTARKSVLDVILELKDLTRGSNTENGTE